MSKLELSLPVVEHHLSLAFVTLSLNAPLVFVHLEVITEVHFAESLAQICDFWVERCKDLAVLAFGKSLVLQLAKVLLLRSEHTAWPANSVPRNKRSSWHVVVLHYVHSDHGTCAA